MEIVLDDQYYLLIMNLKLEQIDVTINHIPMHGFLHYEILNRIGFEKLSNRDECLFLPNISLWAMQ